MKILKELGVLMLVVLGVCFVLFAIDAFSHRAFGQINVVPGGGSGGISGSNGSVTNTKFYGSNNYPTMTPNTPAEFDANQNLTNPPNVVAAGTYGDAQHTLQFQFDASGVPTNVTSLALPSATNKFTVSTNALALNTLATNGANRAFIYAGTSLNPSVTDIAEIDLMVSDFATYTNRFPSKVPANVTGVHFFEVSAAMNPSDVFWFTNLTTGTGAASLVGGVYVSAVDIGNGGEANVGANLGGSSGVYASKTGVTLNFNTVAGGRGLTISSNSNVLTVTPPTTTKGDMLVDNGTALVRVPIGSDTQVWTADSSQAAGAKWATASGGSSLPTINSTMLTAATTYTGSNWVAVTNLTVTITPSSTNSHVFVSLCLYAMGQNGVAASYCALTRNGVVITNALGDTVASHVPVAGYSYGPDTSAMTEMVLRFKDAPATNGVTTYGVAVSSQTAAGTVYINRTQVDASTQGRTISTIDVQEIN
jgi:hypothetical protein